MNDIFHLESAFFNRSVVRIANRTKTLMIQMSDAKAL